MSAQIEIRVLGRDDLDHWRPLWWDYQLFYQASLSEDVTQLTFERLTDPEEPMGGILAFADSRAVGFAHWIRHRSCWSLGDYIYLQDLFTAADARGAGVGRALIEQIYAIAMSLGASRVHWLTHETNAQAMRLYDKLASRSGFIQYSKALPGSL